MNKIFEKLILFNSFKLHFIIIITFLLNSCFNFFYILLKHNEYNFLLLSFVVLNLAQIIFYTYLFIKRLNNKNKIKAGSLLNIPLIGWFLLQFFIQYLILVNNEINIAILIFSFLNFVIFSLTTLFLISVESNIKDLLKNIENIENFNSFYFFNERGFYCNLNNNKIEFSFISEYLIINEKIKISIFNLNKYIKENSVTFEKLKKEYFNVIDIYSY